MLIEILSKSTWKHFLDKQTNRDNCSLLSVPLEKNISDNWVGWARSHFNKIKAVRRGKIESFLS